MPPGDLQDRVHVGGLAEEVDGDNGLGARCDEIFDPGRVQIERLRVDVGEDGAGTEQRGGLGGGDEGER